MIPTPTACRRAGCPSLYESRPRFGPVPASDLVGQGDGLEYGCAASQGRVCRLCGVRPDLSRVAVPEPGQQVALFGGRA